jgi:hypothetical protein
MTTDTENPTTPMQKMLIECSDNEVLLGERIAGVLEFLTMRAVMDAPYVIRTDTGDAIAIFAANDSAKIIEASLAKMTLKNWDDPINDDAFITNADPGDEQEETDESTAEQE